MELGNEISPAMGVVGLANVGADRSTGPLQLQLERVVPPDTITQLQDLNSEVGGHGAKFGFGQAASTP